MNRRITLDRAAAPTGSVSRGTGTPPERCYTVRYRGTKPTGTVTLIVEDDGGMA